MDFVRPGQFVLACVLTTVLACVFSAAGMVGGADLTPEEARVPVTGYDTNRPAAFPGLGEFSWPGNMVRLPSGELLLVHSQGHYHISFAEPRMIERGGAQTTSTAWLAAGLSGTDRWPFDDHPVNGQREDLEQATNADRSAAR